MAKGLGNPHHSSTGSNSANESMGTAADWEHLQPDFRTRSFRVCFGIRLIRKLARKKYIFVRSSEIFTLREGTEKSASFFADGDNFCSKTLNRLNALLAYPIGHKNFDAAAQQ